MRLFWRVFYKKAIRKICETQPVKNIYFNNILVYNLAALNASFFWFPICAVFYFGQKAKINTKNENEK